MRVRKRSVALGGLAVLLCGTAFADLLGILPGFPQVSFNSQGTTEYDVSTEFLEIRASPIALVLGAGQIPRFINPTGDPPIEVLTIDIQVGSGGVLLGGLPGDDDLLIIGEVDADGNGTIDYDGVLLTGEIVEFGWENTGGTTDFFDFRFELTGGSLAPLFDGMDIGLVLIVESSTFDGHFDGDFGGAAKGGIGPIPPKDDGDAEGCTPGFWRQPHHFQFWTDYSPDDLFADAFSDVFGVYMDDPNTCGGSCGDQAPSGCWCSDDCCDFGDCCLDKFAVCGGCNPDNLDGPPDGCAGSCGAQSDEGCWCDEFCCGFGDCCADKLAECGGCDPDAEPSCEGNCGGQSSGCWCDELCCGYGDCCSDKVDQCGGCDPGAAGSCAGSCGAQSGNCWCDEACCLYGDCCDDKLSECGGCDPATFTCEGACGDQSDAGCWCDDLCCGYGDCCADKVDLCGACEGGVAGDGGGGDGHGGPAGSFDPFPGKTLLDVVSQRASAAPGPVHLNNLGRHAVAALLNASSGQNYPYTVEEVIAMFNNAYAQWLDTGQHQVLNQLKDLFEEANEAGCAAKDDPATSDLNSDQSVNIFDMLTLLSNWGPVPTDPTEIYFGDINDDGEVNIFDLLIMLSNWG